MKRIAQLTTLVCAGAVIMLSACSAESGKRSGPSPAASGATATTAAAPDDAVQLAGRYRKSGGVREVHGIQQSPGPEGVPLLTVWTHDTDDSGETFDELKGSITGFLKD